MLKRILMSLLIFGLLIGCSGSQGGTPLLRAPATPAVVTPSRQAAVAHFIITVPPPPPAGSPLKAAYVSPGTRSISIALSGSTSGATIVNTTPGQSVYTVNVEAFAGSNTFNVSLFDQPDATGNMLSTAQVTVTLAGDQPNNVPITTAGVINSVDLSLDNPSPPRGTPATLTLTVAAKDATGNTIVGPYSQPVTLTNSDTSGVFTLLTSTLASSSTVTVTYNGASIGPITLGATVANVPVIRVSNATVTSVFGGVVTTLAGSGTPTSEALNLSGPEGVAVDSSGNIYLADTLKHRIRKLTSAGVVSTLAGSGTAGFADGTGTAAQFNSPNGLAVDSSGNVYVGDTSNHRIRQITPAGVVSTLAGSGTNGFADGTGTAAQFDNPKGIAVDSSGNIYTADQDNNRIRQITPAGVVSTLAGSGTSGFVDGTGTAARFSFPQAVGVDSSGNVYVADSFNHRIRKLTSAGVVSTLAGSGTAGFTDGTGTAAQFDTPVGVTVDSSGNVYVGDRDNHRIRTITPAGVVTTLAGSTLGFADGTGTAAQFNSPVGVSVDSSGNIVVADKNNNRLRQVTLAGVVTTLDRKFNFADGAGTAAQFDFPTGLTVDSSGNVYVADQNNQRIRKVTPTGVVTTLAGNGTAGFADGPGTAAQFNIPGSVTVDSNGNVYVNDALNNSIRKITPAGVVTTLAGQATAGSADGVGTAAQFNLPTNVAVDSSGNVYVADSFNHSIRKITPAGVVSTLAGGTQGSADGSGAAAQFNFPFGVAVDSDGNVYVGDRENHRIRKITAAGVVTTLAGSTQGLTDGTGTAAQFNKPIGVAVDSSGNVYVADRDNQRIRKITPAGVVTTVAGSGATGFGNGGFADGLATAALFSQPLGVAVDSLGDLYVADGNNNRIRKIQ